MVGSAAWGGEVCVADAGAGESGGRDGHESAAGADLCFGLRMGEEREMFG